MVIDDSSDEEMTSSHPPQSSTHYVVYSDKDRKDMRRELSRLSKRAVAKDERARQVSTASSYADDGTIDLIANLRIEEDGGECISVR